MPKLSDTFTRELEAYIQAVAQDEVSRQLKNSQSSSMPEADAVDQATQNNGDDEVLSLHNTDTTNFISDNGIQQASSILQRVLKNRSV